MSLSKKELQKKYPKKKNVGEDAAKHMFLVVGGLILLLIIALGVDLYHLFS